MRTRLLISVALAVALGFAAGASAGENTAVVTVIADPGGSAGTWEVRARLWSSAGSGIETDDLGFLDFVLMKVVGTGDYEVTDSLNAAPGGAWDTGGADGVIDVGFFGDPSDENNYGIRGDGTAGVGIVGLQPVMYAEVGENNPTRDQAVLLGIGVATDTWTPPSGTGDSLAWDADTRVATGTYNPNGGSGTIGVETSGWIDGNWYEPRDCFSVLPDPDDNDAYEGPTVDFGYGVKPVYEPALVTCVVTQTTTLAGNDGGNAVAQQPTLLNVEAGTFNMGTNMGQPATATTPAVANVSVVVADSNTAIALAGNQNLAGLSVDFAQAGTQAFDLNRKKVKLHAGDLAVVEAAALAQVIAAENSPSLTDGIYDGTQQANEAVGVGTVSDEDGSECVLVRLTIQGDATLDGIADTADFAKLGVNWFGALGPYGWDDGDFNRDGAVDTADFAILGLNWFVSFEETLEGPAAAAVPEPCTLGLLGVGLGAALLRRRRRA